LPPGHALPEKPILITFDDGYRSNYDLVYPILQEYGVKACISIIVLMPDLPTDNFCTWGQLREMTASGLVEIGSHSYRLHNLGGDGGNFESGGANGVERRPHESDAVAPRRQFFGQAASDSRRGADNDRSFHRDESSYPKRKNA